mgnify:CR=1 FL=1
MIDFADLDEPLSPDPTFFVEAPDGRKDVPELRRQTDFLKLMRIAAPRVMVFANANAGKRNPQQAKREGIKGGVFDITCLWRARCAYIEFKGYNKNGAGSLTDNQTRFGNRLVELDIPCACFFSPEAAVDWLREIGFPVAEIHHAA